MRKKRNLMVILCLVLLHGIAMAGIDEGRAALSAGNYAVALAELKPLADKGNAEAQELLGRMYDLGLGVDQDRTAAVELFRLSAEQGNVPAQVGLCQAYREGRGVPEDQDKAALWGEIAGDMVVGTLTSTCRRDEMEFVPLRDTPFGRNTIVLREASSAGGMVPGTARNVIAGFSGGRYSSQSAGFSGGAPHVAVHDQEITQRLSNWAGQGNTAAMLALGKRCLRDNSKCDVARAVDWYRKAADLGLDAAYGRLADLYWRGRGVPQDFVMARTLAVLGHADVLEVRWHALLSAGQLAESQELLTNWKRGNWPTQTRTGQELHRRSDSEIAAQFAEVSSRVNVVYQRALRRNPQLQGKMVLQLDIGPDGAVRQCSVASSELNDPELEHAVILIVTGWLHFDGGYYLPWSGTHTMNFQL